MRVHLVYDSIAHDTGRGCRRGTMVIIRRFVLYRKGRSSRSAGDCSRGWMAKRKRSAFSCKSRSQRRPSPRLSASLGPPFTALSRQGGYTHILKGYFYTNLVGTL